MSTATLSNKEQSFRARIERLKARGLEVRLESTDPDDIMGHRETASIFVAQNRTHVFASWSLRKPSRFHKRTSVTFFGTINSKRSSERDCMGMMNVILENR